MILSFVAWLYNTLYPWADQGGQNVEVAVSSNMSVKFVYTLIILIKELSLKNLLIYLISIINWRVRMYWKGHCIKDLSVRSINVCHKYLLSIYYVSKLFKALGMQKRKTLARSLCLLGLHASERRQKIEKRQAEKNQSMMNSM